MSEDSFLTRWSRRKAAAKAEPLPEPARAGCGSPIRSREVAEPAPEPTCRRGRSLRLAARSIPIHFGYGHHGVLARGVPEGSRTAALVQGRGCSRSRLFATSSGCRRIPVGFQRPARDPRLRSAGVLAGSGAADGRELVGDVREAAGKVGDAHRVKPHRSATKAQDRSPQRYRRCTDRSASGYCVAASRLAAPQQNDPEPSEAALTPAQPRRSVTALNVSR